MTSMLNVPPSVRKMSQDLRLKILTVHASSGAAKFWKINVSGWLKPVCNNLLKGLHQKHTFFVRKWVNVSGSARTTTAHKVAATESRC